MDTKVVIIGGGPCGLLSSLMLSRYGVENVLLEKHPGISFHPKAMGTTRRTAEILRQQGLLDAMEEKTLPKDVDTLQIWLRSFAGEELGRVPLTPDPEGLTPCDRFHCPQTHSEKVLLDAALQERRSDIRFHCQMTSFQSDENGVVVEFAHRETGKVEKLRADWMIAADGADSPIREELNIGTKGPGDRGHFLNVYFRADYGPYLKGKQSILYNLLDEEYAEFFVAVNGRDLWLMHHFLMPGETPEDYTDEKFKEIIQFVSKLPEVPVEIISVSPWVMSPKIANQWRSGRIFLTGDAAARLSPSGGLGMNTGLQSVYNLAWKLAAVVHGTASDSLLDTYQKERMGIIGFTFQHSEGNADEIFDIITDATSGKWDQAVEKLKHSRRSGSGLGIDLGLAYPEGALLPDGSEAPSLKDPANDYVPAARPGHRAPHLEISNCSCGDSTLDWYGKGFVLVVGAAGEDWKAAADSVASTLPDQMSIAVYQLGQDFNTDAAMFAECYGIDNDGAVLVRPDSYVAARWKRADTHPAESLREAFQANYFTATASKPHGHSG